MKKSRRLYIKKDRQVLLRMFVTWVAVLIGQASFSQPVITSFSPTSGPVGTTVTIKGRNFNPSYYANTVLLGTIKCTISNGNDSTLVVTIPVGSSSAVFSIVKDYTVGYSRNSFKITFNGYPDVTTNSFTPVADTALINGGNPFRVGDIDGDGKPDIISLNGNYLRVHLNKGRFNNFAFTGKQDFVTASQPSSLVLCDFNGDGKQDVATISYQSFLMSVFPNTGTAGSPSFGTRQDYNAGLNVIAVSAADIDGDGRPDIVAANMADQDFSVYRNIATATGIGFAARVNFQVGQYPTAIGVGDLDGDGKPDVVTTNKYANTISIYRNTSTIGSISFAAKQDIATANGPWGVVIADMNADGRPDVCIPNHYAKSFSIFRNIGSPGVIGFATRRDFPTGANGPAYMAVQDFNGDGNPDVVVNDNITGLLSIYVHSETPQNASFSSTDYYSSASLSAGEVLVADLNADAAPEIVAGSGSIAVMRNLIRDTINRIQGYVFEDANRNLIKDVGELLADDVRITSVKGANQIFSIPYNGNYVNHVDSGNYTTTVTPYRKYYTVVPATHSSSFVGFHHSDTVNIALQPIPGIKDLSIHIVPLSSIRTGRSNKYELQYSNNGTDTITQSTIAFAVPVNLTVDSTWPAYTSYVNDTVKWNIGSLLPKDNGTITVKILVPTPPAVNVGDTFVFRGSISHAYRDTTPADNVYELKQLAMGAHDPNDKDETHGGSISTRQIAQGDFLQYTVRFQNVGNDTAFDITVRDTLSQMLDANSIEMVASSHSYRMMVRGNRCEWKFNNIQLVDSLHNEAGSHGYIVYRIRPVAGVMPGDVITNSASIYFDYNPPVVTTVCSTTVVAEAMPIKLVTFSARKDAELNKLTWRTENENSIERFIIERSLDGTRYSSIGEIKSGNNDYSFNDIHPGVGINYYRLKIVATDGTFRYSEIKMVDNTRQPCIKIYPNPAKEKLAVSITDIRTNNVVLEVLSTNGRKVVSNTVFVKDGAIATLLDLANTPTGTYVLQVMDADGKTFSQKFTKL